MFKRLLVLLMALTASPAFAEDDHVCLEHHWLIPAYRHEMFWQLMAFAAILMIYGLSRGMTWLKKRTA